MRDFIPSDYVDKEGNVYETIGENIREGKNGSGSGSEITDISQLEPKQTIDRSEMLIGKNGSLLWEPIVDINYFNNVVNPPSASSIYSFVNKRIPETNINFNNYYLTTSSGFPSWVAPATVIDDYTTTRLVSAIGLKEYCTKHNIYFSVAKYDSHEINISYSIDNAEYSLTAGGIQPDNVVIDSKTGVISSKDNTKNIVDLQPISTVTTRLTTAPIVKGFSSYGKMVVGWDVKTSYKAQLVYEK